MSEALSDDGEITGRGTSLSRGLITGGATFFGGSFHALPFVISDLHTALVVASFTVGCELIAIAWIRKRFLNVSLRSSLVQVTLGGLIVAVTGALIGQA
jgi:erythrin-vacuolar iron transport family protein